MIRKIKRHIRGTITGIRWQLSTCIVPNFPSQHLRNWGMRKLGMMGGGISSSILVLLFVVPKILLLKTA